MYRYLEFSNFRVRMKCIFITCFWRHQFIMNPWSNKCICLLHLSTSMYATHGVSKEYSRPKFFLPKAGDRNSLAEKALEFLRQAPKNTTAYQTGVNLGFHHVPDFRWVMTRLLFTCSTRIVCKTNRPCILWLCPHYGKQNQATPPKQQYNSAFFSREITNIWG